MAKFVYKNAKNASTGHIFFELHYRYYFKALFEEDVNLCSRSCFIDKLVKELRELIKNCYYNLLCIQEMEKQAHDKKVKSCSYALSKKVWLNNKYIKIKKNKKLKNKLFGLFKIFHIVEK